MCFLLFSGQPAAQLCAGARCTGAAYGLLKSQRPAGHTHLPQKSSPAGALALSTDELGKAPSGTGLEGLPEGHGQGPNEEGRGPRGAGGQFPAGWGGAGGCGLGTGGAAGETGRQHPPGGWGQGSTWALCFPLSMVRSPPKVLSLESP